MSQTLDHLSCDQDRHELLNILCKMCSRQRMIPKSMCVDKRLNGELIEEYDGGHATIFRGEHKGRPVAVMAVRIYLTSDFGKCYSVNILTPHALKVPIYHGFHRNSAEKLLPGGTSDTRTSYHCSV